MEGEDSVRTVKCLRGRLLAERAASRNAKDKAFQLENKLMELETLVKQEAKSRKRAEKKLKFLMKKLESINILHVSDESEYSAGLMDRTDISSISSIASSIIKEQQQQQESNENQPTNSSETQESKGNVTSQKDLGILEQIDSQNCSFSLISDDSSTAGGTSISSAFEFKGLEYEMKRNENVPSSPRISGIVEQIVKQNAFEDSLSSSSDQHSERFSSKMDQHSDFCYDSIRSCGDDSNSQVDDSMALVVFDTPHRQIDPEALDATVIEVLNTLRRAKEQLQNSMERRRMNMIKVGEANSSVKTSAILL